MPIYEPFVDVFDQYDNLYPEDLGLEFVIKVDEEGYVECPPLRAILNALLVPEGKPDWRNIERLKAFGFQVSPGEEDSFGWLTGVLHLTQDKKIVFG
jgi:hypothetical protein